MNHLASRDTARELFILEHPRFERAAQIAQGRLARFTRDYNYDAQVTTRAKTVASFVKKLLKYADDGWDKTTDKVGAQIVVRTTDEVDQVVRSMQLGVAGFTCLSVDPKMDTLDPSKLSYAAVHVQAELVGIRTFSGEQIECEVQIRTQAQDLWAHIEHKLVYKPTLKPGRAVERKIKRLSVLVELFDEEVASAARQVRTDPALAVSRLIQDAEWSFLRFCSDPGDSGLSFESAEILVQAFSEDELDGYRDTLSQFSKAHGGRISELYERFGVRSEYSGEFKYILFSQPESLIVMERCQNALFLLSQAVVHTELERAVDLVATTWGYPLIKE